MTPARFTRRLLAGAAIAVAAASAHADTFVFSLSNIQSGGDKGDSGNTVLSFMLGANALVTSFSWDVNVTAFDPSWLSELSLAFEDSAQSNGVFFNPAFTEDDPGTGTYSDAADLVELGLSFQVGADGLLRLEFFEGFDDASVSPDGIWNFGTITFITDAVDVPGEVPEPASGLLMGAGLALIGYTARRRRTARSAA